MLFSYVSYPSVLPNRPQYRSDLSSSSPGGSSSGGAANIMHDRRVVRGNTYARGPLSRASWNHVTAVNEDVVRQRNKDRNTYIKRRMLPSISELLI